jgi:hypothetical protein
MTFIISGATLKFDFSIVYPDLSLTMLPLLLFLAVSTRLEISTETITAVRLESGDAAFVNATNRTAFIQVQAYYFTGKLTITAAYGTNTTTHSGSPGSRFAFNDTQLTLSLSSSLTTCSISIYLIPQVCDARFSLHSRSIMSAVSTIADDSPPFCWFFDFVSADPLFEIEGPGGYFEVLQNSESGSLERHNLSSLEALNRTFVLLGRPGGGSGSVAFSTDRFLCDWTEKDRPFQICTSCGDCDIPSVKAGGRLTSERSVPGWIWLLLYGIPSAVGCVFIGAILFFPKARKVAWQTGSGTRVLLSDYRSASLQLDPVRYI